MGDDELIGDLVRRLEEGGGEPRLERERLERERLVRERLERESAASVEMLRLAREAASAELLEQLELELQWGTSDSGSSSSGWIPPSQGMIENAMAGRPHPPGGAPPPRERGPREDGGPAGKSGRRIRCCGCKRIIASDHCHVPRYCQLPVWRGLRLSHRRPVSPPALQPVPPVRRPELVRM